MLFRERLLSDAKRISAMKEDVPEIRKARLRAGAEDMLGDGFDKHQFHNRLPEHSGVILPVIGANFELWIVNLQEQSAK